MPSIRNMLTSLWNRQPDPPVAAVGRAKVHRPRHRYDDTLGQTVPIRTGDTPQPAPWARRRWPVNQRD